MTNMEVNNPPSLYEEFYGLSRDRFPSFPIHFHENVGWKVENS